MNIEQRTYHFKSSRWFLFLLWGFLCVSLALLTLAKNLPSALDGSQGIFGYVSLIVIVASFSVFGILSLLVPLASKIILSREGIEFHTIAVVLKSRWVDLKVGILRDTSGNSITLILSNPEVNLRSWARHAPWDVRAGATNLGIPISQFGGVKSDDVFDDIRRFAPNLGL